MTDADQAGHVQRLEADNARLRRLLDDRQMPSVLRHQVRNALGLMRAVLRRSVEGKTSIEDFAAHVEGRFDALLRIQTALLSSLDGRIDLTMLVTDVFLAMAIPEGDKAVVTGPTVRLEARQCELLGLALHELATNAVKFGALTTSAGRIEVSWEVDAAARHLTVIWAETGLGELDPSPSRGFGMDAIEGMLPYQLKADSRVEFLARGLRCTIKLPLGAAELR